MGEGEYPHLARHKNIGVSEKVLFQLPVFHLNPAKAST
jgi:hypothetical protein